MGVQRSGCPWEVFMCMYHYALSLGKCFCQLYGNILENLQFSPLNSSKKCRNYLISLICLRNATGVDFKVSDLALQESVPAPSLSCLPLLRICSGIFSLDLSPHMKYQFHPHTVNQFVLSICLYFLHV